MSTSEAEKPVKAGLSGWKLNLMRAAALLFAVGISVSVFIYRDEVRAMQALGYPGVFLVALLSNATIILPVPGVLFTSLMGAVLHPLGVAFAAGTGAALGEISGYLAGFGGQGVVERSPAYVRIEGWMKKYGQWAILVLGMIPNPFFDIAGMVAGALKMPFWRFLLFCWFGQIGKMIFFAYGGAALLRLIPGFMPP
jgi:membrane protein YqaA with SNARE-associated domain